MNKAPEETKIKEEHFSLFYKKYFEDFMSYEIVENAVQRFAFIFQYLKIRNIGDLYLQNNTEIDCIKNKKLTVEEQQAIVSFFLETIKPLEKFGDYIKKGNGNEEKFCEDELYKAFEKVRNDLEDLLPEIEDMYQHAENLTFLVKNASFTVNEIQSNISSDVHSSPEYFALEYQKLDKQSVSPIFREKACQLEELFNEVKNTMKRKEVSFFCGDLDDRHKFDFLDSGIKRDEEKRDVNYAKRQNFLLYNCFKDFYHTVHAAYQLHCLSNEKTEGILRFQVSGNHEELNQNAAGDKKNALNYFSSLISHVRKFMLPTELNFVLQDGSLATLRHGFFPQEMNEKCFTGKIINQNFKIFYLHIETASSISEIHKSKYIPNSLQPLRTYDESLMNPQLWSDFYNTQNELNLSVLLMDEKESEEEIFGFKEGRGFYNNGSLKKGMGYGKKILLKNFAIGDPDNFEECNEGYRDFLTEDELADLNKNPYFLFCGHSHNQESLKYGLVQVENVLSFRPYFVQNDEYLFHFCLCSHHNLYIQLYQPIYEAYIKESNQENTVLDWSQSKPINLLDTVYGKKWIYESVKKEDFSVLDWLIETRNQYILKLQEKNRELNKYNRVLKANQEKLTNELASLNAECPDLKTSKYVSLENNPFVVLGKVALAAGAISSARRMQKHFTAKETAGSFRKYVVKVQPTDVLGGVLLVGAHAFYKRYKNPHPQSTTRKPKLEQKS